MYNNRKERTNQICLFADDNVLFLTNLEASTKALSQLLKTLGEFSGYKTKNNKTSLLLLNGEERDHPTIHSLLVFQLDLHIWESK